MKKILLQLSKKYWFITIIELVALVINVYLLTLPSKIVGQIVELLYEMDANYNAIKNYIYYLLIVTAGILLTRLIWRMLSTKVARESVKFLQDKLFEKLLKSTVGSLQSIKNGKIMSFFVTDINQMKKVIVRLIPTIGRTIFNFIIVSVAIYNSSNIKLTLVCMLPVCISEIIIFSMMGLLERKYNLLVKRYTQVSEFVQESTDSVRTTKAYVGGEKQYNEFLEKNSNMRNTSYELIKLECFIQTLVTLGIGLGQGIFILYGGKQVAQEIISVADFVTINGYLLLMQTPLFYIPWIMKHLKKSKVSYKRLEEMFNLPEEEMGFLNGEFEKNENYEKLENSDSNSLKLKGNIEIQNLNYAYPGTKRQVLKNINIKVEQGKSLGIIGRIGGGKTTLMNLLLRLYEIPNNKIFIDNQDINTINPSVLRNNICYITQDNFLFSASLKENINLFRDIYSDENIYNSTKNSMIYDEISQMNDGINTIIGEKGVDLSGGQKQRVVISRAFLNKSNIVIFDDTFSALDNRTEQFVLENIRQLTKNKTCIIISNRISDIKHCDEIVVLDEGKIVERGIHSELLNNKKNYYEFYKNQAEKSNIDFLS